MQGRYTWRHDNVFVGIHKDLLGPVHKINRRNASRSHAPSRQIPFVKEGTKKSKAYKCQSILEVNNSSNWHINFDFFGNPTIPGQSCVDTLLRPDIVIYSLASKTILWFEETVPLERNIAAAALKKKTRYAALRAELTVSGWKVHDFTYQI